MPLVPYEEALTRVLHRLEPGEVLEAPIRSVPGLVGAQEVRSPEDVPPFDNTAVDGFALRCGDTDGAPVELDVIATIAAGAQPEVTLAAGTCARIMTGAVIPDGADAVVMVEDTEDVGGDRVLVRRPVPRGAHIRPAGDDLRGGDLAVAAGTRLTAAHVGLLATLGLTGIRVHRRATVGVMSTGDELVGPGVPPAPGQIRDSNRQMLLALCDRAGVEGVDLGLVADDEDAIESAMREAAQRCDAIVTSGGVSMGDYDYVKAVLGRIADMEWMQVAIKPAKPFAFGKIGPTPVFGLPGNPVSSLVSFELFARPGLRRMMGDPDPHPLRVPATAGVDIRRRADGKTHFVRVTLANEADALVARPTGAQGSHQLAASATAAALAVLPDGEGVAAGGPLQVIPIS
jgi:molybdopterin molybdotransferase